MTRLPATGRPLHVCLDLNIWVAHAIALAEARQGGSCSTLIRLAKLGDSALGPIQIVASWRMLDTLRHVLMRLGRDAAAAAAYLSGIVDLTTFGPIGLAPHLVLGTTGVMPLRDTEDAAVLEVAIAAGADLLVTADMADFAPGPRSRLSARVVARNGTRPVVIAVALPVRDDMIIATPQRAADWLSGGPRPRGVLARFAPSVRVRPG